MMTPVNLFCKNISLMEPKEKLARKPVISPMAISAINAPQISHNLFFEFLEGGGCNMAPLEEEF